MNRKLILFCTLAGTIAAAGCSNMSQTEQRTLSGGAMGTAAGVAVGAITGDWAWAAGGAAIGAASGYVYDQYEKKKQADYNQAYQQGVQAGKAQAQPSQ